MKRILYTITSFALAALTLPACTNTDNTMATTDEAVVNSTEQETSNADGLMQLDTEMPDKPDDSGRVSASNQVGRDMNIVALLQRNPNLSTFLELVRAANMVVTLESPAPYTVFAPTNEAFATLPAGTIETLKGSGNKAELTRLLQAHILPNQVSAAELKNNMRLMTATGEEVIVTTNGTDVMVGGAKVITPDVQASNGVVHVINKLLAPPK